MFSTRPMRAKVEIQSLSDMPLPIVNIAAYKFVELNELGLLRNALRSLAQDQQLRGTILLSREGINLFVAGSRPGISALLERVKQIPGVADLQVKESFSASIPFSRMLVKIKKEIIAFGVNGIVPGTYSSRRLSATELKRWLDEGRPVTLLDTRNTFEVETGTFNNAIAIGVDDFRDFPTAVAGLGDDLKHQPVVTFCTGGIRCEKAAPYLEREGFTNVYQLDGGILKYFEQCGNAHYNGDCFVFDQRVALNPQLDQSNLQQCFVCLAILSPDLQKSPLYVAGVSCPQCYQSPAEKFEALKNKHQQAIEKITTPLPGSIAYENVRPISVPLRCDGFELLNFLDAMHTHLSREQWTLAASQDRLACRDEVIHHGRTMRAGERVLHKMPAAVEPAVATDIVILHEDDAIVVVHKPAPLPMHPCGRFNRNSLLYLLNQVYHPLILRPAHRLDANTSGVVVFTKTGQLARKLQSQFESVSIKKLYLARVQGHPAQEAFECHTPLAINPAADGFRLPASDGTPASTLFRLIQKSNDGSSLLQVTPLTGRTNQIRIHLWEMNLPICGDPIYLRDQKLGNTQALGVNDPPLCLHAKRIEFLHPLTGKSVSFTSNDPDWCS